MNETETNDADVDLVETIATAIREAIGTGFESLAPTRVFSDVAPGRRYDGAATLEVGEYDRESIFDCDEGEDVVSKVSVYLRAPTKDEAKKIANGVAKRVRRTFVELKERGRVDYWFEDSKSGPLPDAEGGVPTGTFCAELVYVVRRVVCE